MLSIIVAILLAIVKKSYTTFSSSHKKLQQIKNSYINKE